MRLEQRPPAALGWPFAAPGAQLAWALARAGQAARIVHPAPPLSGDEAASRQALIDRAGIVPAPIAPATIASALCVPHPITSALSVPAPVVAAPFLRDPAMRRRHAVVFYADAGGGHRATAYALREILEQTGRYRVTLFNPYRDLIPHLDLTRRLTGLSGEQVYNRAILRQGRTGLTCWLFYALLKANYLLFGRATVRLLRARFAELAPDVVLSVMPLANDVIARALERSDGGACTPFAILMTDWTEIMRGVWFPPRAGYHAICATPEAIAQAKRTPALARARVHGLDGLLIRPRFSRVPARRDAAMALGLDPARPVITVLYGAHGSARMRAVAAALAGPPSGLPQTVQVAFLCGHDQALAESLRAMTLPFDARVEGFTDRVPDYLAASDLFLGKPGPGSVSEALALRVPVLLDRTAALPQERPVLEHVALHRLGMVFGTMAECRAACLRMLTDRSSQPAGRANRSAAQIRGIVDRVCHEAEIMRGGTLSEPPR